MIGPSPFRCTLSSDRVPCGRSAGSAWPLSSSVSAHISLPAKHQTETASSVIVQPLRRDRLRIERPLAAPIPERQHVAGIIASGAGRAIQESAVAERKSVVEGTSVAVRVIHGGGRIIKKK